MPVKADKPLTAKQTRFAALVAEGMPKAQAQREVYAARFDNKKLGQNRALETANKPNVAAEIRRLTWLACPNLDDVHGMRSQAVRVLSDLSRDAASEEVRFKAALALYKIAETSRAAADPRATDTEQDKLLASLRKLYNQIQVQTEDVEPLGPAVRPPEDEPIDIACIALPAPKPEPAD